MNIYFYIFHRPPNGGDIQPRKHDWAIEKYLERYQNEFTIVEHGPEHLAIFIQGERAHCGIRLQINAPRSPPAGYIIKQYAAMRGSTGYFCLADKKEFSEETARISDFFQ